MMERTGVVREGGREGRRDGYNVERGGRVREMYEGKEIGAGWYRKKRGTKNSTIPPISVKKA